MAEACIRCTARVTAAKRLWRKAAAAALVTGLAAVPAFAQGGGGTGGIGGSTPTLICSVPSLPTGTTTMVGVAQVNCGAPGGALTASNVQFAAEAKVPLNFVLASPQPTLPGDIFTGLQQGTSEIREFVSFTGNVMTVDLSIVPAGTTIPTAATATAPPGTLLTEIRIQVANVIVTDGPPQTMLFSGTVLPSSTGTGSTGTTATPLVPNLFGDLSGRAAAVSLAFNGAIAFPGLGATPLTGGTGTGAISGGAGGMFNGGNGASAQASMVGVLVAGSFAFSAPSGFAALSFPTTSGSTGGGGGTSGGPIIVFAPVQSPTASPVIQLDASPTAASATGPLTYAWMSVGTPQATILNGDTAKPTVEFFGPGNYVIQLTVTDALGRSSTAQITIQFIGIPGK